MSEPFAASGSASAPATATSGSLPARVWGAMYLRLLGIQGSWNYEILLGNGIGFCIEPALRLLPGGIGGEPYRQALARQSAYFNAHPYLAAVADGALARAELDGAPPVRIERFRTALCGPLGSLGDRLVWASWLPACSLVAIAAFGVGATPLGAVLLFLVLYNVGHFALRAWGLRVGFERGLQVAAALGSPWLRRGPELIGRVAALFSGVAIPLALYRIVGAGPGQSLVAVAVAGLCALGLLSAPARFQGWRVALAVVALYVLFMVVR